MKERETGERRGYDRQRDEERSMDEIFEREYYQRYSNNSHHRREQDNCHEINRFG